MAERTNLAETSTRSVAVADWLRDQIVDGKIAANTHLQEKIIAAQTGTSRTPVREALKLLETEGLVLYSANKGYFVRQFTLDDILGAFDVRATLEGMACRIVAEKGLSEAADRALADCHEEMVAVAGGTQWRDRESLRWFDLNFRFHRLIINEAGNAMLTQVIEQSQRLPLIFDTDQRLRSASQVSRMFDAADTQRSLDHHTEILGALRLRQGARAEALMREHIYQSREAIRRNFRTAYPEEAEAEGNARVAFG